MEPFNPSGIYSQTAQQRKRANDNMDQDDEEMQQISSGPTIPANSAKVGAFKPYIFLNYKTNNFITGWKFSKRFNRQIKDSSLGISRPLFTAARIACTATASSWTK